MEEFDPTLEDNYRQTADVHDQKVPVEWLPLSDQKLETDRAFVSTIMKNSEACILVFSTTSRHSFGTMQAMYRRYMTSQPEQGKRPDVILVIATKVDVAELGDKIDHLEGRRFADSIGALFLATSAKENIGTKPKDVGEITSRVMYRKAESKSALSKT